MRRPVRKVQGWGGRHIKPKGVSDMRHPALIARLAMVGAVAAAAAAAVPAAARAETVKLRYDIAVAGTRAMTMKFSGDVGRTAYRASVSLRPAGFMSFFIKKSFDLQGEGRITPQGVRPVFFTMTVKKKKKTKTGTVRWNGATFTWRRVPPPGPVTRSEVLRALGRTGAPDPLGLLVGLAGKDPQKGCRGTRRVFDGHDVYDLRLSLRGRKTFRGAAYRGDAVLCRMVFVPVAGSMSEKKKRQALADPWVFNVWLGAVKSSAAGRLMVPVSAFGRMQGRDFTAALVRASIGGRPPQAVPLSGGR